VAEPTGKKRILVSRMAVDHNRDTGALDPVFTIIDQDGNEYKASNISVLGSSEIKYNPEGTDGNRVWIETFAKVILKDGTSSDSAHKIVASI
jgi:uncharacterized protein YrzB (UPF0473 family)